MRRPLARLPRQLPHHPEQDGTHGLRCGSILPFVTPRLVPGQGTSAALGIASGITTHTPTRVILGLDPGIRSATAGTAEVMLVAPQRPQNRFTGVPMRRIPGSSPRMTMEGAERRGGQNLSTVFVGSSSCGLS